MIRLGRTRPDSIRVNSYRLAEYHWTGLEGRFPCRLASYRLDSVKADTGHGSVIIHDLPLPYTSSRQHATIEAY